MDEKFSGKFHTYALWSDTFKRLYIGHTDNVNRRFEQHNNGRVASTKPYIPYRMIFTQEFGSNSEAVIREKKLKMASGRKFLKRFI